MSRLTMTAALRPLLSLVLLLLLGGCATTAEQSDALYEQLGERDGIQGIVDEFLYALAENELALPLFANTDIERFREQFTNQLCAVAGGPCHYDGDSMADTHRGMRISHAQFNTVVEDLIEAMERRGVTTGTQNRLLARLAPMYEEIAGQ
jgi:hemoglobin